MLADLPRRRTVGGRERRRRGGRLGLSGALPEAGRVRSRGPWRAGGAGGSKPRPVVRTLARAPAAAGPRSVCRASHPMRSSSFSRPMQGAARKTSPRDGVAFSRILKYALDDLLAWYREAATAQPGETPSGGALAAWFWGETRASRLLPRGARARGRERGPRDTPGGEAPPRPPRGERLDPARVNVVIEAEATPRQRLCTFTVRGRHWSEPPLRSTVEERRKSNTVFLPPRGDYPSKRSDLTWTEHGAPCGNLARLQDTGSFLE